MDLATDFVSVGKNKFTDGNSNRFATDNIPSYFRQIFDELAMKKLLISDRFFPLEISKIHLK